MIGLIGKKLTNLYVAYAQIEGWLDSYACFIELEGLGIRSMPLFLEDIGGEEELPSTAQSVFEDLFRHPFIAPLPIYITDLLHYPTGRFDSALLELSTGDVIGEIRMAPSGTGLAGLQYFRSLERLTGRYGTAFNRLSHLRKSEIRR